MMSSSNLPTPCLVVDLDLLEANIAHMADLAARHGVKLRPHAKTHKSSVIARRQVTAGAVGISCSTIDEAEVMVGAGIGGVLVTSPLVGSGKAARFADLVAQAPDTRTVVDDMEATAQLARVLEEKSLVAGILIDVDVGQHRTGVRPDQAVEMARFVTSQKRLRLDGIQAYAGNVQHIVDVTKRRAEALAVHALVERLKVDLAQFLPDQPIVSGGGTGTHAFDADHSPFTELQVGSYVFMDVEYRDTVPAGGTPWPFATSLHLLTTVVSAPVDGKATTDGGTKALATYGPPPRIVTEAFRNCSYGFSGDEHGFVTPPQGFDPPTVGTVLECIVGHCDPTVALFDRLYGVRQGEVVETIQIDARGRRNPLKG